MNTLLETCEEVTGYLADILPMCTPDSWREDAEGAVQRARGVMAHVKASEADFLAACTPERLDALEALLDKVSDIELFAFGEGEYLSHQTHLLYMDLRTAAAKAGGDDGEGEGTGE